MIDDDVKVDELISDIADDLKMIVTNKEIDFTCEIKQVPVIKGNEVLLYRAIYNVVENAIKYTQSQVTVTTSCNYCNYKIEIQVSDFGGGIAEKEIENIFEPFYRIKNYVQQKGLGLGLNFTKSAITIHGRKINLNSEIGKGTVFNIEISTIQ
ncbi:sensor histidine kinase [Wukongibacter sp. M2B1]|uniref:sensor histidine kinase n=1 Tax=Wukongibacter sp. M2B1 TaxID=3088895 RepID=UPI003D7BA7CA